MIASRCFFCESKKIRIHGVGISLSMAGEDYDFCSDCLEDMSADEFWKKIFVKLGHAYPPKLIS